MQVSSIGPAVFILGRTFSKGIICWGEVSPLQYPLIVEAGDVERSAWPGEDIAARGEWTGPIDGTEDRIMLMPKVSQSDS